MEHWKQQGIKTGVAGLSGVGLAGWYSVTPHAALGVACFGCLLTATVWFVGYMHAFCAAAARPARGPVADPTAEEWDRPSPQTRESGGDESLRLE